MGSVNEEDGRAVALFVWNCGYNFQLCNCYVVTDHVTSKFIK